MSISRIAVVIAVAVCKASLCADRVTPPGVEPEKRNSAESYWEQAIDAKGGRRLLIKNAVVTEKFGPARRINQVELMVGQDRLWYWSADLVPKMQPYMRAFDLSCKCFCMLQSGQERPDVLRSVGNMRSNLVAHQLLFFMETPWLKPAPLECRVERIGFRSVDVIRTKLEDELVDFWIDRATHLPQRITFPNHHLPVFNIKKYKEVDRLQLPEVVVENLIGEDWTFYYEYELNADYDPGVFNCTPPVRPDAWRRRTGSQQWQAKPR